jgi:hypothetical protein
VKLRRLTTLKELAVFTPKLLELHSTLDGGWKPDATPHEFLVELIDRFEPDAYFFGDVVEDEIVYFAVVLPQSKKQALFWIFYMNKDFRLITREIILQLKALLQGAKFESVYTQTTRTEHSYERWIKKFGGEKFAVVFKINLTKT